MLLIKIYYVALLENKLQMFFARFAGWNLACYLLLRMPCLEVHICSTEESFSLFLQNVNFIKEVCTSSICTKFNVQIGAGRQVKGQLISKKTFCYPQIPPKNK